MNQKRWGQWARAGFVGLVWVCATSSWGWAVEEVKVGKEPTQAGKESAKMVKDPLELLETLEKRRLLLDERDKKLEIREQDLKRLEENLAARIESMEKLRDAIRGDLEKEKKFDETNIARLGKIYTSMKPGAAAEGLKALDQDTAVKVLRVMPEKVVAKILNKMDTQSAGKLADELSMPIGDKRRRGD